MGIRELKDITIPNCKEKELQVAILDLWFIDKEKNENNEDEGFEIFKIIRTIWPNCYVIFLSNHLNNGVQKRISEYKNIAIFEKTISTSKLLDEIDGILKSINL
jgi:DNA-binding NarL/FixJ family response regulator